MHKPVTNKKELAWYELCMQNQTQHIKFEKLMEINFALEKMYPQNTYKVDQEFWDGELSLSACLGVRSRPPRSNKTANRAGMPAVAW